MSQFRTGDLVLAKMKFCPPWPGKIDVDPKGQTKKKQQYVMFFGTNDHAWILEKDITKYDGKLESKAANTRAGLNEAIAEINAAFEYQREAHRDLDEIRKHRQGQRSGDDDENSDGDREPDESSARDEQSTSKKRTSKAAPKRARQSTASTPAPTSAPTPAPAPAKRERNPSAKADSSAPQSRENGASKRRSRRADPDSASPKRESEPDAAATTATATTTSTQRNRKRKQDAADETTPKRTRDEPVDGISQSSRASAKRDGDEHERSGAQPARFAFGKQCAMAAQRFVGFDLATATIRVVSDCGLSGGAASALPTGWRLLLSALVHKLPHVTLEYAVLDSQCESAGGAKSASVGDWPVVADAGRVRVVSLGEVLKSSEEEATSSASNELMVLGFDRAEPMEQLLHRDAATLRLLAKRLAGRLVLLLSSTQVHPSVTIELCEALVKAALDASTDHDQSTPVQVPCFVELSFVERDRVAQSDSQSTPLNEPDARDSLALLAGGAVVVDAIEKPLRDASVCKVVNVGPELGSAVYFTLALRALQTAAVVSTAECFAVLEKSSVDRSTYREVLEHSSMRCDTLLHTLDVLASQNFAPASAYVLDAARRDSAMFRQVAHAHSASAAMTTACAELLKRVDARRRDKDGREDVSVVYKAIVQP